MQGAIVVGLTIVTLVTVTTGLEINRRPGSGSFSFTAQKQRPFNPKPSGFSNMFRNEASSTPKPPFQIPRSRQSDQEQRFGQPNRSQQPQWASVRNPTPSPTRIQFPETYRRRTPSPAPPEDIDAIIADALDFSKPVTYF